MVKMLGSGLATPNWPEVNTTSEVAVQTGTGHLRLLLGLVAVRQGGDRDDVPQYLQAGRGVRVGPPSGLVSSEVAVENRVETLV